MARWPTALLAGVFVVGYALVAAVLLVRGRVLSADTYKDALVRNDAYERVYTEVLADPELAEQVELLLGGLRFDEVDPAQVRALSTSALRWAVPPSTIRRGTEGFLAATLGYVRGDRARIDADVDLTPVLDRLDESTALEVRTLLAGATDLSVADLDGYRAAVASFASQLGSGTVPGSVPVPSGAALDAEQVAGVLLDQFGSLDAARREQVLAAVAAGDARDGLVNAAGVDTAAARDRLATALEDRHDLDVIGELADRAGRSRARVVGQLDTVRDAARWFRPATAVVGVVLMVGAAGGLLWRHRARPRDGGLALAAAAVASGLVVLVLWVLVARAVGSPFDPALSTGPGSWNLPAGVRSLLGDVTSTVGSSLTTAVRRLVLFPVVAGAVGAALLFSHRALAVAGGAVAAIGVVIGLASTGGASSARQCNGHAELCDRRYDEVVYGATHNSMSSPDVVFVWPEQDADIRAQLDDGVRALLIDTHHWTPLVAADQLTDLPPDLATQVYGRLGPLREARDGAFLCHNQCALGAIPFLDSMETVREWLELNPDEVVTLIIQDAISPEETAAIVGAAGLDRYLHTHEDGSRWATLGELIDRDERLVVFAESSGPPPAWYHPAFELMQDTPFRFAQLSEMSCAVNRGPADASLFLVNHWVQRVAPDRAVAVEVNAHDVLVDRARRCQDERDRLPNYIAVDFANIGDLGAAVDTLNEVG